MNNPVSDVAHAWAEHPPIDDETPRPLYVMASRLEERVTSSIAAFLGAAGLYPHPHVYGGYASVSHARIIARVLMSEAPDQRMWLFGKRGWRQFFDAQVPHQPVLITFGRARRLIFASRDGHLDVTLTGHGLAPGWGRAQVQVLHADDVEAAGIYEDGSSERNLEILLSGMKIESDRAGADRTNAGGTANTDDAAADVSEAQNDRAPAKHSGKTAPAHRSGVAGSTSPRRTSRSGASRWRTHRRRHSHTESAPHGPIRIRAGKPVGVNIRVVGDNEQFGIISDVDDTVIVSMVPRPLIAIKHALVDRVSSRESVPGMAQLLTWLSTTASAYQSQEALHTPITPTGHPGSIAGTPADLRNVPPSSTHRNTPPPDAGAVTVYLSTGAWNVAPMLRNFLSRLNFPRGSFLLTDWGPSNTGFMRSGPGHKRRQLRRLARDLPHIRWILIGDDGQRDPMLYAEFAREHPDKVAGIAIRSLSPVEQILAHGTVSAIMPDALHAVPASIPVWFGSDGFSLRREIRSSGLFSRD